MQSAFIWSKSDFLEITFSAVVLDISHLSSGHVIFQRVHRKAQDIVIMTEVKALRVLLSVIHHSYSRHMIHHLSGLSVKQVIPAVAAPVPETQRETSRHMTCAHQ